MLDGVGRIIAVHCDPSVDAGRIGLRPGPITSACDRLEISLDGPGGHTARPHLTTDLVTAAAKVATEVPALLARRVDARGPGSPSPGGVSRPATPATSSRSTPNSPAPSAAWTCPPGATRPTWSTPRSTRSPRCTGPKSQINYVRGVPPVVNDPAVTELLRDAHERAPGIVCDRGHRAEPRRRGLLLVPGARARRDGPARRPVPGSQAPSTCIGAISTSTKQAIQVGVELFTAAALIDGNRS